MTRARGNESVLRNKGILQIPVDTRVLGISIVGVSPFAIRVVATGERGAGQLGAKKEYWYTNTLGRIAGPFYLAITELKTEDQARRFLADFTESFVLEQVVGYPWVNDKYEPSSPQQGLYSAPDPDDDGTKIGLLIEQDDDASLRRVTWFKTTNAKTIFKKDAVDRIMGSSLRFEAVLDDSDRLSTDPKDIDPDENWYHPPVERIGPSAPPPRGRVRRKPSAPKR
jgi:hypothetical protein